MDQWTPDFCWTSITERGVLPGGLSSHYSDAGKGSLAPIFYIAWARENRILVECRIKDPKHYAFNKVVRHRWIWDKDIPGFDRWRQVG